MKFSEYFEAREVINQKDSQIDKLIKLYKKAIDSKLAKDGKEFFKEFNKTYGLPWPTALSSDDIKRAEFLIGTRE